MRLVADTHVLVDWLLARDRLSRRQRAAIERLRGRQPLLVSDMTLLEIANLVVGGRLRLPTSLASWLDYATAPPLVERVAISPAIAGEVASLPLSFHRDPADRAIVATARVLGATLVTSDQRIIASGVVETIA